MAERVNENFLFFDDYHIYKIEKKYYLQPNFTLPAFED